MGVSWVKAPHDFVRKWYTIDTWQILDAVAAVPNCTILTLSASGRSNDTNIQIFCAEQAFCTENLNFLAITFFNFKKNSNLAEKFRKTICNNPNSK